MKNHIVFYQLALLFTLTFFSSCNNNNNWQKVYVNNKKGETIFGSKQNVIDAIRKGADIKIGWQSQGKTRKIEHLSSPIWLAVANEKEVIAYLDPQVFGNLDWNNLTADYKNKTLEVEWRVVITTSGSFDAVWYNRKNDSLVKRIPQKHQMTWFAKF